MLGRLNWSRYNRSSLVTTLEVIDHIIWNRSDCLNCSTLDHEARLRTQGLPLGADHLTTGLGIRLELVVLGLPQAELFRASWWLHMLDTDMDPLADDASINLSNKNYVKYYHARSLQQMHLCLVKTMLPLCKFANNKTYHFTYTCVSTQESSYISQVKGCNVLLVKRTWTIQYKTTNQFALGKWNRWQNGRMYFCMCHPHRLP